MADAARQPDLGERNRRLGMFLVGWILALAIVSLIVIWVRN